MLLLKGKLTCVSFPSLCNVVLKKPLVLVLVLEGKITCVIIPSWCNVFDFNVVVPVGKLLSCISFHSPCIVVVRNSLVLVLEGSFTEQCCCKKCPYACARRKCNMH